MKIPLSREERAYWNGEDISYAMRYNAISGEWVEVSWYKKLGKEEIRQLELAQVDEGDED